MNPLTYLGFTIFSIIMQFCVMEFIQERLYLEKDLESFNETAVKNEDIIKNMKRKPHALFYRTETDEVAFENNKDADSVHAETSTDDAAIITSTDMSSTSLEVLYENSTIVDDFFTTESIDTTSEYDNVTEITFLDKSNTTAIKRDSGKRRTSKEKCFCNLLYRQCDINCCCDSDCTIEERNLFKNCGSDKNVNADNKGIYFCNSFVTRSNVGVTDAFNDLFCIAKVNLPDKRITSGYKLDTTALNSAFKWNSVEKPDISLKFVKKKYEYGDPIFLLKNEVILPVDLPNVLTNDYCNGKRPLKFLVNEDLKCNFKLKEFYAFSALETLEETKLISITELSMNSTALNCSTLHCTNWKILACNENMCGNYNKTTHAPVCTDNYCSNVVSTMEFNFHYFESKIINASLKLYLTHVNAKIPLFGQTVLVKWYLGNESIDNIIQLSGNPGYIQGMPVIVSSTSKNHSSHFFNGTNGRSSLAFPQNVNGQCKWLNIKNKTLMFGLNTRLKCRLQIIEDLSQKNATSACQAIQANIKRRLRLDEVLHVSPLGNPQDVNDDNWIPLEMSDRIFLYGEYSLKKSRLVCYNLVARYALVIAYSDASTSPLEVENKIVKANVDVTQSNITFDLTEITFVLTIDTNFVDVSRPYFEFAGAPDLNIHLPANFFFDLPLNSHTSEYVIPNVLLFLCCSILIYL